MHIAANGSCLAIIDPPASGAWNMAIDAALLEAAVNEGVCAVRWYQWVEPTLSLGHFQDQSAQTLAGLPIVRRLSGGGAIVHDQELTYSCVIPAGHPLSHAPQELYSVIHQNIAEILQSYGFPVTARGKTLAARSNEFLCFGRGDAFDLVVNETKVLGSAQRRRKGAVLQHGSLILTASPSAPQFPGLLDLCPTHLTRPSVDWLLELGSAVARALAVKVEFGSLPESVRRRAAELAPSIFHLT